MTAIKILVLAANPKHATDYRLGEDIRAIHARIESAELRDQLDLIPHLAIRPQDFPNTLLKHKPHILHFSGDGNSSGIFVEDETGEFRNIGSEVLEHLLATIKDNLLIVVLVSSYSEAQARGISRVVDFAIGMRDGIDRHASTIFAAALYGGLAFGRSVQESFDLGVNALMWEGIPINQAPVLFCKEGANATETYLVRAEPNDDCAKPVPHESQDATIHVDLIVQCRKTAEVLVKWQYTTDQHGQILIQLELQKRQTAAEALTSLPADRPLDLFLFLRGTLIESLCDERTLGDLVRTIRARTSQTNTYIVWDQLTTFPVLYPRNQMVLENWFRMLLKSDVSDLIEIPRKVRTGDFDEPRILWSLARKSETRFAQLSRLASGDGWRVVLRDGALSLEEFLESFRRAHLLRDEGSNLAVFYDQRPPGGWSQLLKKTRGLDRRGHWCIGVLTRKDLKDLRDIEELWLQEANESEPARFDGIFEFSGSFEWLYALLRLACKT